MNPKSKKELVVWSEFYDDGKIIRCEVDEFSKKSENLTEMNYQKMIPGYKLVMVKEYFLKK